MIPSNYKVEVHLESGQPNTSITLRGVLAAPYWGKPEDEVVLNRRDKIIVVPARRILYVEQV